MPKGVIKGTDDKIHPTEILTIMLSDMSIDNNEGYRTLKQLGAIVCFQNKKVAYFMAYQWQFLKQLAERYQGLPDTGKLLAEIK
jgi:hypothetical protein